MSEPQGPHQRIVVGLSDIQDQIRMVKRLSTAAAEAELGRLDVLVGTPGRQFVMVGICGGYTTFSSFSLETLYLARAGEWIPATANAAGSVILCMLSVWVGYIAATALNRGV